MNGKRARPVVLRDGLTHPAWVMLQIARELVDHPDAVVCEEIRSDSGRTSVIDLHVDPRDVGRLLGKKGDHTEAMRVLLRAAGGAVGRNYTLEIHDHRSA